VQICNRTLRQGTKRGAGLGVVHGMGGTGCKTLRDGLIWFWWARNKYMGNTIKDG
jgi:hypothetical protein